MFVFMRKIRAFLIISFAVIGAAFAAPNLTTEINMDIRAGTASKAKAEASDAAVRGGIIQIASRYADRATVENLIMGADDDALQNLVVATRISNEKTSKTAYAARFSITLDRAALEKWYSANNVPNFLAAADDSDDRIAVAIEMSNGLSDWVALNQAVRESGDNYGLILRSIFRGGATASIRASKKRKFQSVCANAGWSVSSRDGAIRIAK